MFGLNIVSTPMAREVRTEWRVEPHPIKKRRRGWQVVKHQINRPGAYQSGNTIYAHPEIVDQLRSEVQNARHEGPGKAQL